MLSRALTVACFSLFVLSAPLARAQCVEIPDCVLVWADEFDGDTVDLTKWEYMIGDGSQFGIPGWGNNELQFYTDNNTTVSDGVLTITAREEQIANKNYTSARLRSLGRGDWTFGRFEMRAKLPVGQGMWPAFWMLSSNPQVYGVWAASGEIDIMESTGDDPERILGTIHYGGSSPQNVFTGESTRLPAGTIDEFHDYAVEWRFGEIRWYLDGQLYAVQSNWWSTGGPYPAPFDLDFHLLMNLAVGGNLPGAPDATTVFPQEFVIDYVRVYQTPPEGTPGALVVVDDMEHANPFGNDWFVFNGDAGGGSIGATTTDLPPSDGGNAAIFASYSSNAGPGFIGGFGRTARRSLAGITAFSFWINPDADQSYTLQFNLQEDDNGDGNISSSADDEFQYNCVVSPTGPCAISGGGWQRVSVPLTSFYDDNGFLTGGNGDLDADGAEELINVVAAIVVQGNGDASFRTDYWAFNGPTDADGDAVADVQDNCLNTPNPGQRDTNSDGYGNLCDADLNNDCVVNFVDLGGLRALFFTVNQNADLNGDGIVNVVDLGIMRSLFFEPPGPSALTDACATP